MGFDYNPETWFITTWIDWEAVQLWIKRETSNLVEI